MYNLRISEKNEKQKWFDLPFLWTVCQYDLSKSQEWIHSSINYNDLLWEVILSYHFSLILLLECFPVDCKWIIPACYKGIFLDWENKMYEKFINIKANTLLVFFCLQFKLKEQKCRTTHFFFCFSLMAKQSSP